MKEFDPTTERHYGLLYIKAVEPGCTMEWQIENLLTGRIIRGTTTDDPADDRVKFVSAVVDAATAAWEKYQEESHEVGTTALE